MARRKLTQKEKTLKALQGSIKKWENILTGKIPDKGSYNCPLCQMFIKEDFSDSKQCAGCPVRRKTGEPNCTDSPYITHWAQARGGDWAETNEQILAARTELDFLRSLLPKRLQIKRAE